MEETGKRLPNVFLIEQMFSAFTGGRKFLILILLKDRPWSKQEDELIIKLVEEKGTQKWSEIAKCLPGRIGKQCRERWYNRLNPEINKTPWTKEEELALVSAHREYGNQ